MTSVDLFTGLGGFALAAHANGIKPVCFVEKDEKCRAFLAKAWPGIPIYDDVKTFSVDTLANLCYSQLQPSEKEAIDMLAKKERYDEAVSMYDRGLSVGDLAKFYEITRQAMWMILKRRDCKFRTNHPTGKDNVFYRGGKRADERVSDITDLAFEKGILIRQTHCSECNQTGGQIEAHHDDYNKPLDVRFLCHKCHFEWHKNRKSITRKEVMPNESRATEELSADVFLLTAGVP